MEVPLQPLYRAVVNPIHQDSVPLVGWEETHRAAPQWAGRRFFVSEREIEIACVAQIKRGALYRML
jgi:hypothetical protein